MYRVSHNLPCRCTHLVPDFCGMSMEKANRLLQEIKTAKSRQSTRMSSHSPLKPSPEPPSIPSPGHGKTSAEQH
ncbi:Serine/threonine kinase [Puccinia graminis f. sp. tritici]|uniref:Serine/threonine kinase n=1 Tax=Puccinia graminis f. sp. tritici TaxID=56615 RepID=A0A5B0S982_PUCGR|nr:Serine/threonine kinase [Puccinia graminis f. sp. tritici]